MNYVLTPLRFNQDPTTIDQLTERQQKQLLERIDDLVAEDPAKATFRNTILPLEEALTEFSNALNPVLFLKYVSTDVDVRKAADRCETKVSQLYVDLFVREDLFKVVKAASRDTKHLDTAEARLLEEYVVGFRRNGLELPPDKRQEFVEKKKRLVLIEAEFAKALVEWDEVFIVTAEQLKGAPPAYVDGLKKMDDGRYRVTLSYPDYFTFMETVEDADARRQLELKFFNRGGEKNRALLAEALKLRDETARMLGYQNHAHFVLERRMAKKPEAVLTFLARLRDRLRELGKKDLQALLEAKREHLGDPKIDRVQSYDTRFYETRIKRMRHQIDMQKLKEYFPLDVVLKGMFEIYENLLGVSFRRDEGLAKWHESAVPYRVEKDGQTLAVFYMDLFPRDGKYGHAAAFTLLSGNRREEGVYLAPVSAIVANFSPPSADRPSLLEHGEVETLFHEFGHIMHQVLTTARFATFAGTSVLRDFVEAPSQMLENWVWEKAPLAQLSGHYQDKSKPLPDEAVERLLAAKHFNSGLKYLRQVFFATLDLRYHTGDSGNTTETYRELAREISLIPIADGTMPEASFGHLMGGYDAGYYGYLWSEVFAADMFTRFEKEGLLNRRTGQDYLDWILRPGGEREPADLIKGFLGREPNEEAFLKSIGL